MILSHCKWLPTAVFNGHDPGDINQQIIQVDVHQWIYHKTICYFPHDGDHNCTADLTVRTSVTHFAKYKVFNTI